MAENNIIVVKKQPDDNTATAQFIRHNQAVEMLVDAYMEGKETPESLREKMRQIEEDYKNSD